MKVASINIGQKQPIQFAKESGVTGIYKQPRHERVRVTSLGLVGDAICDTENHGGVDQAVYVYGTPDYAWWSDDLQHELEPGTFGENITITELESAHVNIGDRFHMGSVILEVTAPRIPCVTLARRMNDPMFVKRFRQAERPGFYCRVIQEGFVQESDPVTLVPYAGETVSVLELFRDFFAPKHDIAMVRRHLAAPIAVRARAEKEQELAKLLEMQQTR